MTREIYCKDQASNIFPHVSGPPDGLIIGGPAAGNEAQVILAGFPGIQVIGCEPVPAMLERAKSQGFPGVLLPLAIWNVNGTVVIAGSDLFQQSSVVYRLDSQSIAVQSRTIDSIDSEFGPFSNVILWLAIQGSEPNALRGAEKMFSEKRVSCAVLMVRLSQEGSNEQEIEAFMKRHDCVSRCAFHNQVSFEYRVYSRR